MLEKQEDSGSLDEPDSWTKKGWLNVEIKHKPIFGRYFSEIKNPISDYSFAACYMWADVIKLKWKIINEHLCVLSTAGNEASLMLPPIGSLNDYTSILDQLTELCEQRNSLEVEYISSEFVSLFDNAVEDSGDYIYETAQLISFEGPELASKRQAKNRFIRRYSNILTLPYEDNYFNDCEKLMKVWEQQGYSHEEQNIIDFKRSKDISATKQAMKNHKDLGLKGMVLFAENKIIGFTFGELLKQDTCNILIEKTDKTFAGSAAYIYNEFCKQYWGNTQFCNAGDDWNIPSLAWTKESYNPAYRLKKYKAKIEAAVYA